MPTVLSPTPVRNEAGVTSPYNHVRALWLVLVCILASRLILLGFAQWLPGDDGLRYLQEAENLVHYATFSHLPPPSPAPTTHDLPLFPLLLSAVLRFFPEPASAMRAMGVFNAIFFTAAAGAVFGLARLLTKDNRLPVLAAALFASFPESLPYSLFSMPESLFLMLFLWAVLLHAQFLRSGRAWEFLGSFVLLGASILSKPATLFFAAVFLVWSLCFWPRRKEPVSRRVLWLACGLLVEAATVSPWIIRNRIAFGSPTLTTITGTNLFDFNYAMMLEDQHVPNPASVLTRQIADYHGSNPVEEARIKGTVAKHEILTHPRAYLLTNLKRHPRLYAGTGALALLRLLGDAPGVAALDTWQAHPSFSTAHLLPSPILFLQLASWIFLGAVYLGAAFGALFLLHRRRWLWLALTVLPLAYFAAVIGPVVYTRYRLPMDPFLALLTAYCILTITRSNKNVLV